MAGKASPPGPLARYSPKSCLASVSDTGSQANGNSIMMAAKKPNAAATSASFIPPPHCFAPVPPDRVSLIP